MKLSDAEAMARIRAMTWAERWELIERIERVGTPFALEAAHELRDAIEQWRRELN